MCSLQSFVDEVIGPILSHGTITERDSSSVRMSDCTEGSRCDTCKVDRVTMSIWYRPARCLHKPDDMLTVQLSGHTKNEPPRARGVFQEHDYESHKESSRISTHEGTVTMAETMNKQEGFFSCKSQSQPATKTINKRSLSITRRLFRRVFVTKGKKL
jgi:hypothetical protein